MHFELILINFFFSGRLSIYEKCKYSLQKIYIEYKLMKKIIFTLKKGKKRKIILYSKISYKKLSTIKFTQDIYFRYCNFP